MELNGGGRGESHLGKVVRQGLFGGDRNPEMRLCFLSGAREGRDYSLFTFSPLATLYIMWDLFFFNVNYLFFNCFTELCWFLPNINSMWDLSSLVRDLTCTPAVEPWSPNRWITREVPVWVFVILLLKLLAFTLLISFTTNSDFCITVQAQGVFFFLQCEQALLTDDF